jgi:hypothetical protein
MNLLKALSIINESGGSGDAAVQYSVLANGTPDMESWLAMPVDSAECSGEAKWIESNETVVI